MELFFLASAVTKTFYSNGGFFLIPVRTCRMAIPTCRGLTLQLLVSFTSLKQLWSVGLFFGWLLGFQALWFNCCCLHFGVCWFVFKPRCKRAAQCGSWAWLTLEQPSRCLHRLSCWQSHLLAPVLGGPACRLLQKHWWHWAGPCLQLTLLETVVKLGLSCRLGGFQFSSATLPSIRFHVIDSTSQSQSFVSTVVFSLLMDQLHKGPYRVMLFLKCLNMFYLPFTRSKLENNGKVFMIARPKVGFEQGSGDK